MTRITPLFIDNNIYFAQEMRSLIEGIVPSGGSWNHQPQVVAPMSIQMQPGCTYVPDTATAGPMYACVSDAPETILLNTPPASGQSRIDLIFVRPRPATNDWIFDITTGTPAATPTRPPTPAGTIPICAMTVIGGTNTLDPLGPGGWTNPSLVDLRRPPLPVMNARAYWMQKATNINLTLPGGTSSLVDASFVAPWTKLYGQGSKVVMTMHVSGCWVASTVTQGIWHSVEFTHGTGIGAAPVRTIVAAPGGHGGGSGATELLGVPPGPYNIVPNVRSDQNATVVYYGYSHQISLQLMEVPA